MAIDDDTMELLERRMTEKVEEQVRSKLIKRYSLISGGVLSVLAVFGYNRITDYEAKLNQFAQEEAATAAKAAVGPAIQSAQEAADRAAAVASTAEREVMRTTIALEELEKWRTQGQTKLSGALDKITDTDARIDASLANMDQALANIQEKLKTTEEQIDSVQANSGDKFASYFLSAQKFEPLITNLSAEVIRLGAEVKNLKTARLGEPATSTNPPPVTTSPPSPALPPPDVARQQQQIQASLQALNADQDTTIFFQFAGASTREEAKAISAKLAERGYKMPGEERIGSAAGLHEIRYFYDEDAEAAKRAAGEVNAVLAAMGYKAEVKTKSLTGYSRTKPRQGVLELWLEPKR